MKPTRVPFILTLLVLITLGVIVMSDAFPRSRVGGSHVGGGTAAQTIASVNLSNATYTSSVANAPVGAITVTMSPASPPFSGAITLTGANTGGFHNVGTCAPPPTCTLEANTGGTTGNGPYTDLNIVATTGALTLSITPTLTGSSALTLTETPAPSAPTISSSSPPSVIQKNVNTWSNSEAFVGTNTFCGTSSYWDADTYQMGGDFLIIAPNGPGVGGAGGTTQHVCTEAIQMDMSPDLTISNAPAGAPLANKWGIFNWGPIQSGRMIGGGAFIGGYVLWLNGVQIGSGDTMEVAHSGVLYLLDGSAWYTWSGHSFDPSGAP